MPVFWRAVSLVAVFSFFSATWALLVLFIALAVTDDTFSIPTFPLVLLFGAVHFCCIVTGILAYVEARRYSESQLERDWMMRSS